MTFKHIRSFAGLLIALGWIAPVAVHAVGLSPIYFEAKGMLANSSVSRRLFIARSNPAEEEKAIVTVRGPAAPYIRLPDKGIVVLPKGVFNTPFDFFIEPGNLTQGEYTAKIHVAPYVPPDPNAVKVPGSSMLAGAEGTIVFTVTNDVVESIVITKVETHVLEEGQPVDFQYSIENKGNVDARPSKIDITLTDPEDPAFSFSATVNGSELNITKALAKATENVHVSAQLSPGTYLAKLQFFSKELMIYEIADLRVTVYPKGSLEQKGEITSFVTDKGEYQSGEIVGFKAVFANRGSSSLSGAFQIHIFQDDKRVDVLSSEATFVPMGGKIPFEKTYKPKESGDYTAKAFVEFGPNKSNEASVDFIVKSAISTTVILISLSGLIVLILLLILIIHKLKPKKSPIVQPAPPAMPPPQP